MKFPLKSDGKGIYIFDGNGDMVMEMRGWGALTGGGKMSDEAAEKIQIQRQEWVIEALNESLTRKGFGS